MCRKNLFEIINATNSPLILDGAIGSLLQQKGYISDKNIWTTKVNFDNPDLLIEIHEDYIKAGCDIITTNTFRTNPIALERAGLISSKEEWLKRSISISRKIADKHDVILAGSNPPAEDCYQIERTVSYSDLKQNHEDHIQHLLEYGVDFILNETQSHFDEIDIICNFCSKRKLPYCLSLFITDELRLLSGESIEETINYIKSYKPIAILFNCISDTIFRKLLRNIKIDFCWGYYLNCGSGSLTDTLIGCGLDPNKYAQIVKSSLDLNPKIIGACCGSNPDHIKQIRYTINETFNS